MPTENSIQDGKTKGIRCLHCGETIWSRHRHDFRWCSCDTVAVDGGREYLRIVGDRCDWEIVDIEVDA